MGRREGGRNEGKEGLDKSPEQFVPGAGRREGLGTKLGDSRREVGRWARDVLGSSCERKVPVVARRR